MIWLHTYVPAVLDTAAGIEAFFNSSTIPLIGREVKYAVSPSSNTGVSTG